MRWELFDLYLTDWLYIYTVIKDFRINNANPFEIPLACNQVTSMLKGTNSQTVNILYIHWLYINAYCYRADQTSYMSYMLI